MDIAFAPPVGLLVVAASLAGLLGAIVPTCLYLYVEPRGRRQWAVAGDTPGTRRAPALVRLTAWLSFVVGQLAIGVLLVPAACGFLLYAQLRLGVARPVGLAVTGAVGVAALAQSILGLRQWVLGVKLLARDARLSEGAALRARAAAAFSVAVLGGTVGLRWALSTMPSLVHPVLRHALIWTAVWPVLGFAALSLLHALMLGRCAQVLLSRKSSS
jgi:hypothetical protein